MGIFQMINCFFLYSFWDIFGVRGAQRGEPAAGCGPGLRARAVLHYLRIWRAGRESTAGAGGGAADGALYGVHGDGDHDGTVHRQCHDSVVRGHSGDYSRKPFNYRGLSVWRAAWPGDFWDYFSSISWTRGCGRRCG